MSNDSALLALLAGCFPNINVKTWEVTPLAGLSGGNLSLTVTYSQSDCACSKSGANGSIRE
ncbi:hypothetical protein PY546_09030 [Providencia stuartii]|nr:hypothetical protein [Providencia stuartii]